MDVLSVKPVEGKKISSFVFKVKYPELMNASIPELDEFLSDKNRKLNFATIYFDLSAKDFSKTYLAKKLAEKEIPYFAVDIPEFAMGYLYQEIAEKEQILDELCDAYDKLEEKDSLKAESMKNWIDLTRQEIQEKETFLSMKLRPQWIVKQMLDIAKTFNTAEVAFVHFVQEDVCEEICTEVVEQLRCLEVKVMPLYKKKLVELVKNKI